MDCAARAGSSKSGMAVAQQKGLPKVQHDNIHISQGN